MSPEKIIPSPKIVPDDIAISPRRESIKVSPPVPHRSSKKKTSHTINTSCTPLSHDDFKVKLKELFEKQYGLSLPNRYMNEAVDNIEALLHGVL